MRARPEQLSAVLRKGLAPVYLLTGDEPLQLREAQDAVRAAARAAGYGEREVLEVEAGFDWDRLGAMADSLSLFGDRRLVELRMPGGRPGQQGGKALAAYCERPAEDTVLMISSGRLEPKVRKSAAWVKAIDQVGVVVEIWPIGPAELPRWLTARMQAAGLRPTTDAAALLAERSEGNLMAAAQEVDKLRLLLGQGEVTLETVQAAVADSARYDVFDLCLAALQGDSRRVVRILNGLHEEGVEPVLVLWALARELRVLVRLSAPGSNPEEVLRRERAFGPRKTALPAAARRGRPARWQALLARAARVDRVIKGAAAGRPWDELLHLSLAIAGTRTVAVRTLIE
ncbi:MAG: DNA polymerase III subunit delta [Ectothiorhodospiraceae bacterium]|nr:DNA polymerase III subunit delta [Ectothiorhodospiraceae bacterium]